MSSLTGLYQCTDCSKVVNFRSISTHIIICSCGTVLRRNEADTVTAIALPILTAAEDYLQCGTTGNHENQTFEIIGRCRVWTEEAVYNYWTVLLQNGQACYLTEAYG